MGGVRSWLMSLICVSVLAAMAESLMPKGAVQRVGKLVCGLVILCAVLTPLVHLDLTGSQKWLEDWLEELEQDQTALQNSVNTMQKQIIEEDCAAYIVDKAAELGVTCTARVTCQLEEENLYIPWQVEVGGTLTDRAKGRLSALIGENLGVPAQRQSYYGEGELP